MGVVRRWGFHGLPATHGQSDRERAPGSLGRQHSISQGVHPGKKMAGHWGVEQVTSRNLDVVKVQKDKNLIFVCAVGQRSALACEMAAAAGLTRLYNLEGGTDAWIKSGMPAEK